MSNTDWSWSNLRTFPLVLWRCFCFPQRCFWDWSTFYMCDKAGTVQPGERLRDFPSIFKYLMAGNEGEGAKFSSLLPSDRTRSNGYKTKKAKIISEHKKALFVFWKWSNTERMSTEKLWSFHLWRYSIAAWTETWETYSNCLSRRLHQMILRFSFQSEWFCDFRKCFTLIYALASTCTKSSDKLSQAVSFLNMSLGVCCL